jgi:hypothetical protein
MDPIPQPTHRGIQRFAGAALLTLSTCLASLPCEGTELVLVAEAKLAALLGDATPRGRLEASGVLAFDGRFYVVFDSLDKVAVLPPDDRWSSPFTARVLTGAIEAEGIARDHDNARWYLVEEARLRGADDKHSRLNARLHEYRLSATEDELRERESRWLDYSLQGANKGIEGVAVARRDGRTYLLALCEGNDCDAGQIGRAPGNGRIKVFRRRGGDRGWKYVASIDLPRSLPFLDYAGVDLRGDRLAVVSQESSALWLGTLEHRRDGKRELWRVRDRGRTLTFPTSAEGKTRCCNVEGVSWVDDDTIVVVSDEAKDDQLEACRSKDQSIHVFRIPAG